MADNLWIDDAWWRDWLFWLGFGVATVLVATIAVTRDSSWWALVVAWLGCFSVVVASVGFVRTARRSYRADP